MRSYEQVEILTQDAGIGYHSNTLRRDGDQWDSLVHHACTPTHYYMYYKEDRVGPHTHESITGFHVDTKRDIVR
jgi:hypothetical protein